MTAFAECDSLFAADAIRRIAAQERLVGTIHAVDPVHQDEAAFPVGKDDQPGPARTRLRPDAAYPYL